MITTLWPGRASRMPAFTAINSSAMNPLAPFELPVRPAGAQAQMLAGEVEAATATFERAVAAINDVGLLAEEVDPASGEMIGNFPQAFSHIGPINAAWAISQAQQLTPG
jgi:hypothetical protein